MSFLSDVFHGNFSNLGTDLSHSVDKKNIAETGEGLGLAALTALSLGTDLPALAAGSAGSLFGGVGGIFGDAAASTGSAITDLFGAGATTTGADSGILTGGAALGVDPASYAAVPGSIGGAGATPFDIGPAGIDQYLTGGAAAPTGGGGIPGSFLSGSGITDVGSVPGTTGLQGSVAGGVTPTGGVTGVGSGGTTLGGGTAAAGTAAPTAPASAWTQFANDPLGTLANGATKSITSNPLGIGVGLAGLGYNIYAGQKTDKNVAALQQQATQQSQQGQQLESYLQTGTLPPGLAAQMSQATAANKARIISNYAAQGQSTDPTKNSALAQDLASVDMQAQAMQGQIATQLLSSGQTAVNMSDQIYQTLAQIDQNQAQNMGKAIANFASSLAGKTNVSVGGAGVTLQQAA